MSRDFSKWFWLPMRSVLLVGVFAGLPALSYADKGKQDVQCRKSDVLGNIQFTGVTTPGDVPIGMGVAAYQSKKQDLLADVTVFLLVPPKVELDGTMLLIMQLLHDFGSNDTLRWQTKTYLTPAGLPGEFVLNEDIALIEGTGKFTDAFGKGYGNGPVSFTTGQGVVDGYALVCFEEDKNNRGDDRKLRN